jgi:SecD/SecF fusion protein
MGMQEQKKYSSILKKYFFIILFSNAIACAAQHPSRFSVIITGNTASKIMIDSSINVLKKRMEKGGNKDFTISYDTKSKEIIIDASTVLSKEFITKLIEPLKVEFCECYNIVELVPGLLNNQMSLKLVQARNAFFTISNVSDSYHDNIKNAPIGFAKISDTAKLNRIITQLKSYLPKDCTLAYQNELDDINNNSLALYALKNSKYKIDVNTVLDSVQVQFDDRGYPLILLHFNKIGTNKFSVLTQKNRGKFIAIAIDRKVYSTPMVNGIVEGGKAQIVGAFTVKQAYQIAKMLSAGSLPIQLKLIE